MAGSGEGRAKQFSDRRLLTVESMQNINREHPEYVARKAMWKQYKDLYAGGEQLRLNACDYLVRRQKEPAPVYEERLRRGFFGNHVGANFGWGGPTAVRTGPTLVVWGK